MKYILIFLIALVVILGVLFVFVAKQHETVKGEAYAEACVGLGCPNGTMFVGSKNSNKFHECTSRHAKNILPENIVCFNTQEDAAMKGYEQGEV